MHVREATSTDCDAVIALWTSAGLARPWNDPALDFERARSGPTSCVLVGIVDERPVATAMVGFDGHRGGGYYLAVAADHRRVGAGRRMMAEAEQWLNTRGAPKVELMVRTGNDEATAFYTALGYDRVEVEVLARWLRP